MTRPAQQHNSLGPYRYLALSPAQSAVLAASERRRSALPLAQRQGFEFPQVALAGRAVKRIAEATGREASTIARFLHSLQSGRRKLKQGLMVFDESSMLDLPALYQLLVALPPEIDLLFIGDPAQLPPIGPGLVFHRMVESPDIPKASSTSSIGKKRRLASPPSRQRSVPAACSTCPHSIRCSRSPMAS